MPSSSLRAASKLRLSMAAGLPEEDWEGMTALQLFLTFQ
jgi:hypothetical protein